MSCSGDILLRRMGKVEPSHCIGYLVRFQLSRTFGLCDEMGCFGERCTYIRCQHPLRPGWGAAALFSAGIDWVAIQRWGVGAVLSHMNIYGVTQLPLFICERKLRRLRGSPSIWWKSHHNIDQLQGIDRLISKLVRKRDSSAQTTHIYGFYLGSTYWETSSLFIAL